MSDEVKKMVKDIGDAVKEGVHRGNADAEHETRNEFGEVMTPREKAESVTTEISENTKAELDRAKRKLRDLT